MAELKGKTKKPNNTRFKEAATVRNTWNVVPEDGTPFEDVLNPEYWENVAERIRPGDHIEVVAENGEYYAELYVTDTTRKWAKVAVLTKIDLTTAKSAQAPASPTAKYEVGYKGPILKWCVVRISDKSRLHEGSASKEDAQRWLADYSKAQAA
jgi:hypothetical protein